MLAGLVGACVGAGVGYLNARVIGGVVVGRLEALDRSATPADKADFARRLKAFRAVVMVVFIGGTAAVGFAFGRWAAGVGV
jgi:hypothetical protein